MPAVPEQVRSDDGTPLAVRQRGEGPAVVLVHGASSCAADWSGVARLLAGGHRVVSYDRRGRGASGDGAEYSFEREVEDLHAVLRHVGEPAHLVAHSFGARLALAAAPAAELRTLTLYEPPLAPQQVPEGVLAEARAAAAREDWGAVLAAFQPMAGMTAEEIAFCASIPSVRAAQLDAARTVLRELEELLRRDVATSRPVAAPALLLVGGSTDAPVYLDGLEAVAGLIGADVVRLPGQRHVAMAGDPAGFVAALRPHLARA